MEWQVKREMDLWKHMGTKMLSSVERMARNDRMVLCGSKWAECGALARRHTA